MAVRVAIEIGILDAVIKSVEGSDAIGMTELGERTGADTALIGAY